MKISRRAGGVRLRLDAVEATVLAALFADFAEVMEADELAVDDDVRGRLFPAAYPGDESATAEFRAMTESGLRTDRAERARSCAAQLTEGGELQLADEDADTWIRALNDLRLTLGIRLGVTEDDVDLDRGEHDPDAQEWAVYHWLTGLQDLMVRALMR
ncbi:MAG: hypothetical protein QOG80_582 [Pseudonocardiales bacterium]|nr:hypothetical protein [Pseudonocardiales bacterium]